MFWRTVLLVGLGAFALSIPVPDHPSIGAFQPLHGARGPSGQGSGYDSPPAATHSFSAPSGGGFGGGPSKTIYVNVPPAKAAPAPAPIAAGPPRKHYKIVFIRAPAPPPAPQPILPPRTEQKTLIYVLHQRPEAPKQEIIEVPTIKHNPEVFFVQYDNPPTAEELQQLTAGTYGPQLQSGILPQLNTEPRNFDRDDDRAIAEAGPGSPNLIQQADESILNAIGPADGPVFFSPLPAPIDPSPAAPAPAAPAPAPAAPQPPVDFGVGVPLSAVVSTDSGAPIDFGAPLDAPAQSFNDLVGEIPLSQAAQIFDSSSFGGVPLSEIVPSAPAPAPADNSPNFGVPLSAILGNSPSSAGGVPIPSLGSSPGGSTIAAGVLQNEGPQTFPFELNDAFGQRTVQRRR